MMRLLALPLLLALAACSGFTTSSPGSGPEAVCEREAANDPTVRHLEMRQVGNPNYTADSAAQVRYLREQAKRSCLRRLGALPPGQGGVEAVRQPFGSQR